MAAEDGDGFKALWEAVRSRVCSLCLDGAENGVCRLEPSRHCALDTHFEAVVRAILAVTSTRVSDYLEAVERDVCSRCEEHGSATCRRRDRGECGVMLYVPLIIEAIEGVTGRRLIET